MDGIARSWSQTRLSRRAVSCRAGGGVVAAAAAACTPGGQAGTANAPAKLTQPASLAYWSILTGADGVRMEEMTRRYVQETPLVQIEIQALPDFLQKFTAASVAGTPPDLIWIRQTYIPGFADRDMLLDLLPRELGQVGLRAEDFDPTVWKASEYKGKRYTVPMDIHGYHLIWNEGAVRDGGADPTRAPASWQDWLEWANRLTQGERFGATVSSTGGGISWQFHGFMLQAAKQAGLEANFFTADGRRANLNNAAGNAALTLMADIWRLTKHPLPSGPGNGLLDLFERRHLASMVNGPWNLNRLASPGNPAYDDLRVALCPQRDPAKPSWWAQSHQVALARPQKPEENKRAAAFDFVRWLTEHTFEWSKAGQLPASKKVLASDQYQKSDLLVHRHLKVWEKNLTSATFMPLHPRYVELEVELGPVLARGVMNEVSPQAALGEAEQLVNTLLTR